MVYAYRRFKTNQYLIAKATGRNFLSDIGLSGISGMHRLLGKAPGRKILSHVNSITRRSGAGSHALVRASPRLCWRSRKHTGTTLHGDKGMVGGGGGGRCCKGNAEGGAGREASVIATVGSQ